MNNVRRGVIHGRSKLTEQQVLDMRRMYARRTKHTATYEMLAAAFGVAIATVQRVIKRQVYRDIP